MPINKKSVETIVVVCLCLCLFETRNTTKKIILYRVGIKIESQTTFIVGLSKCVIS